MTLLASLVTALAVAIVPHVSHASEVLEMAPPGTTSELTIAACPLDARVCADGTVLSRDWRRRCQFPDCPKRKDCPQDDVMTCPDGRTLARDPNIGCEFPPCELKCCDTRKMPRFIEGGKCCGATGEWVASIGDGSTFTCNGFTTSGPDYPPPFGEPCPIGCGAMLDKDECRGQAEKGCRWMYSDKTCVHEDDMKCPELGKRNVCKSFDKCKWRKNKCLSKCRESRSKVPCTKEMKPVMCKGCKYDNLCLARAAGQKRKRCQRICTSNAECENDEVCFRGSKSCMGSHCPGNCVKKTGNTCDGFLGTTCPLGERCVPTKCPAGVMDSCGGHCVDDGCRKPSKNTCSDEFNPVTCGDGCKYKNQCLANHAGYNEDQCEGFCPLPNPRVLCPLSFPPLKCGENECEYNGMCHAGQVGFSAEQCKPDCSDVACPAMFCRNAVTMPGECCPRCDNICPAFCPPILCMEGYVAARQAGDCCDSCIKKEPDCSLVDCANPICPRGQRPVRAPGECCAQCEDASDDCSTVECPEFRCPPGMRKDKKPGKCCAGCVEDEKELDCRNVLCALPDCHTGHRMVREPDQCCPKCVPDGCDKPDCRLVRCFYHPNCKEDEEPFYPNGSCCATKCIKKVYCKMRYQNPQCGDGEELVEIPGKCGSECKKKCRRN